MTFIGPGDERIMFAVSRWKAADYDACHGSQRPNGRRRFCGESLSGRMPAPAPEANQDDDDIAFPRPSPQEGSGISTLRTHGPHSDLTAEPVSMIMGEWERSSRSGY